MNVPEPLNPYALATWGADGSRRVNGSDSSQPAHGPGSNGARENGAGQEYGADQGHGASNDSGTAGKGCDGAGGDGDGGDPSAPDGLVEDPNATVTDFSRPDEYGRRALNTVRAVAKKHGYVPQTRIGRKRRDPRDRSDSAPGYSGARPDPRDPQRIGAVMDRVLGELGWDDGISAGKVLADWGSIVGPAIAEHCTIVSLDEGILVVTADSSAWAAQLRMLKAQLITTINERVGRNVVDDLRVSGPSAATWKKGRRTVKWRGPRDTYG